jgi:hypothetical protein
VDYRYSKKQILGNVIMTAGIIMALLPTLEEYVAFTISSPPLSTDAFA